MSTSLVHNRIVAGNAIEKASKAEPLDPRVEELFDEVYWNRLNSNGIVSLFGSGLTIVQATEYLNDDKLPVGYVSNVERLSIVTARLGERWATIEVDLTRSFDARRFQGVSTDLISARKRHADVTMRAYQTLGEMDR